LRGGKEGIRGEEVGRVVGIGIRRIRRNREWGKRWKRRKR
jgi:hypothetical protein